jgi:cyclase
VKGVNFVGLRDAGDPVEVAQRYDGEGADELTFLDITASHERRKIILDVVARTADTVFMPLTVGGGVREIDDIRDAAQRRRRQGVDQHRRGAAPGVRRERLRAFGSQCIVVADRRQARAPRRRALGGLHPRRPHADRLDAIEWARAWRRGAGEILLTSMDRDGTKAGYDIALTARDRRRRARAGDRLGRRRHARAHPRGPHRGGATAALAASIFHYREYTVAECKQYLADRGVRSDSEKKIHTESRSNGGGHGEPAPLRCSASPCEGS